MQLALISKCHRQRTMQRNRGKQQNKRKQNKENNRLEISSRKLEITKEHFMQRWAQ